MDTGDTAAERQKLQRLEELLWVAQAQAGDSDAFGRLMNRYEKRLLVPISRPPWFKLAPECWLAKITVYLGTNSPIFVRTDYQPLETDSQCYGYNAGGTCQPKKPQLVVGNRDC